MGEKRQGNPSASKSIDDVLPPPRIPEAWIAYGGGRAPRSPFATGWDEPASEALERIFSLIRAQTGHDFSCYKRSTIGRRIERRMKVHQVESVAAYEQFARETPGELDLLAKELLIGVTSFFRDPEAWARLSNCIDGLLTERSNGETIRAWVPGCSTGEEAYSLTMLLRERMDALQRDMKIQIFATDLDAAAIDRARSGSYPSSIARDVSPERLARFFTQDERSYVVRKELRELLVFAPHNLIDDPPFTKLDLLSCRNLLIYFDATLQKKLLPTFHHALRPDGILFLGPSESVGSLGKSFLPLDTSWKIYGRIEAVRPALAGFSDLAPVRSASSISMIVARTLLRDLVPPTVLAHKQGSIVYVHGEMAPFLQQPQAVPATANVLDMARPDLNLVLSECISEAATTDREVVRRNVPIREHATSVDVRVVRLEEPASLRGLFRITFSDR